MPWLVLGIAVVIGLILIGRGLFGLDPKRAIKIVLWIILMAMVLGGTAMLARWRTVRLRRGIRAAVRIDRRVEVR